MESNSGYVTNLVNSIIGVSVLAMPYCFKQCGIILGLGLLAGAAYLTSISCHMLATSAFHKKRRTYEYLALYTLGPSGKFAVELSMIGLILGTCVAFYVVIGDLATEILEKFIVNMEPPQIRTFVLIFCAFCIALPLGLMKDLSVLGYIGIFSLLFYIAFVSVVILNAVTSGLLQWVWWNNIVLWKPEGIFKVLPIFSLAFSCHCQLFVVYDSLENPSVRRMDTIVSSSLKFVSSIYMLVGFFGYTTFQGDVEGNLLKNFKSNVLLDVIKLGFALSVVVGFPLMIFPCRQSIYTLFFSKATVGDGMPVKTYIAPFAFKSITLCIVVTTMVIAIMIPNVETILGLTGATMGSLICYIFPALIFEKAAPKGPSSLPKLILGIGLALFVISTYTNLQPSSVAEVIDIQNIIPKNDHALNSMNSPLIPVDNTPVELAVNVAPVLDDNKPVAEDSKPKAEVIDDEKRLEPANPVDPVIEDALQEKENEGEEREKVHHVDYENKIPPKESNNHEAKPDEPEPVKVEKAVTAKREVGKVAPQIPKNENDEPDIPVKAFEQQDKIEENMATPAKHDDIEIIVQENKDSEHDTLRENKDEALNDQLKVSDKQDPVNDGDKESVNEKVLLEKIKVQHEKQQELLQKQEELIKALEIHQDHHEKEDMNKEHDEQNEEHQDANSEIKLKIDDAKIDKNLEKPVISERNEKNANDRETIQRDKPIDNQRQNLNPVNDNKLPIANANVPAINSDPKESLKQVEGHGTIKPLPNRVAPVAAHKVHDLVAPKPGANDSPVNNQANLEHGIQSDRKASVQHVREIRSAEKVTDCLEGDDCVIKPKTRDLKNIK